MKKEVQPAVFDKFADNYDEGHTKAVKASGFSPSYFHEYKVIELFNYLKLIGKEQEKLLLLNYGCGIGSSEKYLKKYFPNLIICSVDISEESIRVAKKENEGLNDVTFKQFDGVNIPFEHEFDIIFIANVFHHIPRKQQIDSMKALNNRLKADGFLIMFELNPINPLTLWVAIQNDYKFDKDSKLLNPLYCRKLLNTSGFRSRTIRFTIFFPAFLSFLKRLEKYLYKLPIGAHYYYIARKING
ncbi:MAG: class I SAM-dependent methyltransferase [Candidatus Firestonebacteria bacterium]